MKACMKGVTWDIVQMEWCSVVEWVESSTLRGFGHIETKKSEEFVNFICHHRNVYHIMLTSVQFVT